MIKLSILIPSVHTRRSTFLPRILDEVYGQYEKLSEEDQSKVEILTLIDNKKMMLGEKRNRLVDLAQGQYYIFVDDDDRLSDGYISELLQASSSNADIITFFAEVSINKEPAKKCIYSSKIESDYNTSNEYYRLPNHICAVRTEIGRKVSFPNIKYGEDSAYSKLLKPYLKTEYQIQKALYYYDFNTETTETQEHLRGRVQSPRSGQEPVVDVVILSNAKTPALRRLTEQTISSCISGANQLPINIIVVEQVPNVLYSNASTIKNPHEIFNYNATANFGAKHGKAEWIMIANNDLTFTDGWLHELLAVNHSVMSPHEPNDPRQSEISQNTFGTVNGKHFSGWCFMIRRELWKKIGGFDDCVNFWFSDDVTIEQVLKLGVEPVLVKCSLVNHLGSSTLLSMDNVVADDYTWGQVDIFNTKYGKSKFNDHPKYIEWKSKRKVA